MAKCVECGENAAQSIQSDESLAKLLFRKIPLTALSHVIQLSRERGERERVEISQKFKNFIVNQKIFKNFQRSTCEFEHREKEREREREIRR